jgi:CRISPR-associated protein Cas5h
MGTAEGRAGIGVTPVLAFDLRAGVAHFRRPDASVTHASYPFIPRTALRGLLGAVLGMEAFLEEDAWTGVRLLAPVRTQVQGMLLLGKGYFGAGQAMFNRRTSVEFVVAPHYRIYYTGAHLQELHARLRAQRAAYPTYLGSAFALTVPERVALLEGVPVAPQADQRLEAVTVVPAAAVGALEPADGAQYARAGGMLYRYLGGRRFRGAIHLIYEVTGLPISFRAAPAPQDPPSRFYATAEGLVALW